MEYPGAGPAPKKPKKKIKATAILAAVLVVLLIIAFIAFTPYVMVPTGHTGVVVTMGRVSDEVLPEGLHFKLPWQNVVLMDNRAQKASAALQAFSSDIQQVNIQCSINYSVDRETSQKLYQGVGTSYYATVMEPRILENVKAVFSKYTAENLIGARETLATQIKSLLGPELKEYGIELLSVAIEDIDFSDAFTDAVESKQVAEQTKLKTEIEQAELLLVEQNTAERSIINANAEAEVARINAEAEAYAISVQAQAEADANKLLAASVTDQLIQYLEATNWDGALPQVVSGESGTVVPVISPAE